jgi:hypothetical protein
LFICDWLAQHSAKLIIQATYAAWTGQLWKTPLHEQAESAVPVRVRCSAQRSSVAVKSRSPANHFFYHESHSPKKRGKVKPLVVVVHVVTTCRRGALSLALDLLRSPVSEGNHLVQGFVPCLRGIAHLLFEQAAK